MPARDHDLLSVSRQDRIPASGPRPAAPAAALITQLQRSAGNQAVCAMLARTGGGPAAQAATPEQEFDAAVKDGVWDRAASAIVKVAKPVDRLILLTVDQLRPLQDALVRRADKLGPNTAHILGHIDVVLQTKGVDPAKTGPGTTYGKVGWIESPLVHGNPATGTPYVYGISFTFTPDVAAVDADQIAFIQTVRVLDATGADREPDQKAIERQTGSHSSIDASPGDDEGWYSMKDNGTADTSLKIWDKSNPATPAWMLDRPSGTVPGATWSFETAVVCLSGKDTGMVYATVLWGFTSDAALKITPTPPKVTNKQSRDFTLAVEGWNEQAADPDASKRNSPSQKQLPALR